jgi:hypothetical protein
MPEAIHGQSGVESAWHAVRDQSSNAAAPQSVEPPRLPERQLQAARQGTGVCQMVNQNPKHPAQVIQDSKQDKREDQRENKEDRRDDRRDEKEDRRDDRRS